jgi:signal transduction histidine kinase
MRELKDAAEAASRAKNDFLAVMSHELRTPLNAILGYGSLVADAVVGPLGPTQKHHLERIIESARFLLEMVDQVLRLSRLDSGRERVQPGPVDVPVLVGEVAALIRPAAAAKGLGLLVNAGAAPAALTTDRAKLRLILLNLLDNAVKFTPAGHIELTAEAVDGTGVAFRVRDTGPGIPARHRESVFEPFEQVDQSHTRREGGAGLGLSVSRRLARLLGGDVTVESEPGRGSTFTVMVPVGGADVARSPAEDGVSPGPAQAEASTRHAGTPVEVAGKPVGGSQGEARES